MKHFYFLVLLILATSFSQINADVLYVKPGTSSTAWQNQTNVYSDLQIALADAVPGDEVWVAAGMYKPTTDGDRTISFELKDGVHYYGGFVGDETELSQRDWNTNETILSGDIGVEGDNTDNSYNVVKNRGTESEQIQSNILDGFIIEQGNSRYDGGGLYIRYSTNQIRNVLFRDNQATRWGGAVYTENGSNSEFFNVLFVNNSSGSAGAAVMAGSDITFVNCLWYGNSTSDWAGAIYKSTEAVLQVYNSIAWNNASRNDYDFNFSAIIENSIFKDADGSNGNISQDPVFVAADKGDFRLSESSPGVNAGNNEVVPEWLKTDYSGGERIMGGIVDIGAFEGVVVSPELFSPGNDTFFDADQTSALLEWGWSGNQPDEVESYTLEYRINDEDPVYVENLGSFSYTLTDLNPNSVVQWRVAGVDASGNQNWSSFSYFWILRGHPLYVTPNGTGNGSSWNDAMTLQSALDESKRGDSIWAAEGTYYPTNTSDRYIPFKLKEQVKLFGGFAGNESTLAERNWSLNETILSGNIGDKESITDNSQRIVEAIGTSANPLTEETVLDGFVIEGGYGNQSSGIFMEDASILVRNLWIRDNYSSTAGGAIRSSYRSNPKFGNVLFTNNSSDDNGGAVYLSGTAEFYNCTWFGNYAQRVGAAVMGDATITNSISWGNYSGNQSYDFFYYSNVRNSIFEGSDGTNGNISQNPMFVAPGKEDFRLQVGSPGINSGVNEDVPEWLTTDGLNNDRILESVVDLGVFEGGVESPKLLSPLDGETLESEILEVLLTWEDGVPEDVSHYMLEYSMNEGDPVLVENLQNTDYNLSGFSPATKVAWRICSVTDEGREVWSEQYHFSVLRGRPVFVTPDGTGNGASWSEAMNLQDALNNAMDGDSVWVAAGIYKPTETNARDISFLLPKNIKIFGGFEGTETEINQRNHVKNKTVLSGDIGEENVSTDNSYHVLSAVGTYNESDDWNAVVDGFIVENGYADGEGHRNGGGLYLEWASPLLVNMHFKNNYALYSGGAVYDAAGSQAEFANVVFTNNTANQYGGAVYASKNLRYFNCVWFNNNSRDGGGAAYGYNEIFNSIFWKNTAEEGYYNDLTNRNLVFHSIYEFGNSDGNLAGDPDFIDAENGDFRLREESMALNAGDNEAVPDWLFSDYFGESRILEETIDLGISEGKIVVPSIISPEDQSVVSASEEGSVILKWSIEESEVASTISGFILEWVLGEDTTFVENIDDYEYSLSGLVPFDAVSWRIGYVDKNDNTNWSAYASFDLYRGHPLFVVDDGTGDGTSWQNGIDLKEALNIAVSGDSLWISAGIYKPASTTDRSSSFVIDKNLKLFGGFSGVENSFDERNSFKNQVVLSGDIGEPGVKGDNSYHVVEITGSQEQPVSEQMILDGVTIENGFADVYDDNDGGGLIINRASPIIKNVWFRNNYASDDGGAVYVDYLSNPLFGNVLFWKNESGDDGGAVYSGAQVNYYNCVWLGNYSGYYGGAVYDISRTSMVYNSIAWDNKAEVSYDNFHYGVSSFYSIFNNASDQNGNFNQEPGFVSVDKKDFRLKEGSPAINSGNSDYLPDWLTSDFYGNSRLMDDSPDVGIFEGSVVVPTILSPEEGSVASIEESAQVLLEWTVDAPFAEDISSYQIEYIVNSDTFLVENIAVQQYALSGLQSLDSVMWRVGYQDETGLINWSSESSFIIHRGHPIYVVPNGTGDGSSWANAMDLEAALKAAVTGDSIWVAAGTYKPTNTDDRNIFFELKENVKLFGGFAGTETTFSERNLVKNQTILSGEIGEEDVDNDNSYHVVQVIGSQTEPITLNTVIDGLIIEKGYADEDNMDGGGLLLEWASPILRNVWFRNNYAVDDGGAVYGNYESQAQFGNVIFTDNESGDDGGAVSAQGNIQFYNCVWYGNISGAEGGAVYGNNAIVNNSIAWGNSAEWGYNDFSYWADVTNSIYSGAYSGDDNISQNPDFVDPANDDFRLKEGSPAINAGSTENVPDWMITDYHGYSRIQEDIVDIGTSEGWVISPELKTPAENSYFEADVTSVSLAWGWGDSIPDNINTYEIEYTINDGEPQIMEDLTGFEYEMTGLSPADVVTWRVCSVDELEFQNWSDKRTFTIYRNQPIYVKPGARGNGTSWLNAIDLKDALKMAIKNDEIWVAAGTYKPTYNTDREASFELKNGVKLYGGFDGYGSSREDRNWLNNPTILSGDIGVENDSTDNTFTVLKISNNQDSLLVDGVIIEDGNADRSFNNDGGGLLIASSSLITIQNVWLRNNHASDDGGAVYVGNDSNPKFVNVIFSGNKSGDDGGAVYASHTSEFYNCVWYGNYSGYWGGAVYGDVSIITNSIAWANEAERDYDDFYDEDEVSHSIFKNADNNNGNTSEDPLFLDPRNAVFNLSIGSPAINAGNNELVPESVDYDFAGFDRIYGENVDLGPFEHVHLENISPLPQGSGTKEFNMLGMLELSWGITDGTMAPDLNIPDNFDFQLKLWKEGEDENLLQEGPFSPQDGMPGTNNSTHVWELESGNTYFWSIGLDYGCYAVWSEPTTFYIGHDHAIKVKEGNNGTTGKTWTDAFGSLPEALDYAIPGDEIWVAAGTYYPVTPADPNNVTQAEREEALSLKPGLLVYGGFAGDESNARDRNHLENPTILSGDIGVPVDNSDNSVNLIRNEFEASAPLQDGAIVEGFIFEGATGSAIYNVNASPSVEYSVFRDNQGVYGGAVYNESSSPRFFNVLFHNNKASENGGAIYADVNSKPELLSSTITDNTATTTGGLSGIFDVKNSIVYGNENGQFSNEESEVVYSCVEEGYEGEENISFDPMWTDPDNNDYTLQEFSPCIDQGNQSYFTEMFSYDLAKQSRTHWMNTDMGAFEVQEIGKLEVVETSISTDSPVDFIDSLFLRFNQPIALDTAVSPVFDPALEFELKVSEEDSTVLIISHPGLQASSDYHLELPGGQVSLANNDKIIQWFLNYDFTTRSCIPVALSVENPDVAVCPRTSVTLEADVSGDALDYFWVFNQEDTLSRDVDSLLIDTVMPENAGEYVLKVTDWCGTSDEVTVNLQYKSGTELVVPAPKWNTVYFVDNNTGNLSDFKWYLNGEEVGTKQYLDTKSLDYGELSVVAYDEASQCLVYGEVGQLKSASLKSALVSPNPVASGNPVDIVLPEISEKSRIRLYDMRGAKLIDQEYVESSILQLENTDFSSGVYLLQIEYNDGFIENKKLIIE